MFKNNFKIYKFFFVSLIIATFLVSVVDAQQRRKRKPRKKKPQVVRLVKPVWKVDKFEKIINNYEIYEDGKSVETFEVLRKIDSPYSESIPQKVEIVFNSDIADLEVLYAFKIGNDGKQIALEKDRIEIRRTPQAEAAPAFSSLKMLSIDFGSMKTGEKVYYKIKRLEKKSYFDGKFSDLIVFSAFYDYGLAEVNVRAPAGIPIVAEAIDLVGGKVSEENGFINYSWRLENFKGFPLESGQTNYFDFSPKLSITSFKSYQELAEFYKKESDKKNTVTPLIQETADGITEGIEDPKEQASAIYLWVNKNIRYLSIILDRGGWIPHSATSILKNGYGDCKDYSTLIQALLKAKGIESSQVLVRMDDSYWFPKVTMPEAFNHVILYIPELDLYADATAANTRLGLISTELRGKKSVLVSDQPEVITIADSNPKDNQFISEVDVKFNGLGDVQAVATNTYVGESEMVFRPVFADSDFFNSNSDYFVGNYLNYYGIKGEGKILNVSDSHKVGKPFNVEMEVNVKNFTTFRRRGTVELPIMLNLYHLWDLETTILPKKTNKIINVGAADVKETFNVEFPAEIKITKVPANKNIDTEFGTVSVEYQLIDNKIIIKRKLLFKKGLIQPNEYLEFKKFVRSAIDNYSGSFSYRTTPSYARKKLLEKRRIARTNKVDYANLETLTKSQVLLLENLIRKNPEDIQSRKRLIKYFLFEATEAVSSQKKLLEHQLWFIRNKPTEDTANIFGYQTQISPEKNPNYEIIKSEWLKAVENNPQNHFIRFNAIQYFIENDFEITANLIKDGEKLFPDRFEYSLLSFVILKVTSNSAADLAERNEALQAAYEKGIWALLLIKKERSERRDVERAGLLPELAEVALELEKYEQVKTFARELILEYGDEVEDRSYITATHRGNILLGKVAIAEKKFEEAKEYLITSVRAPMRVPEARLSPPDLELAEVLLRIGEKDVVLDYLKLNENLVPEKKSLLQQWQKEINDGKTPAFDWFSNAVSGDDN